MGFSFRDEHHKQVIFGEKKYEKKVLSIAILRLPNLVAQIQQWSTYPDQARGLFGVCLNNGVYSGDVGGVGPFNYTGTTVVSGKPHDVAIE